MLCKRFFSLWVRATKCTRRKYFYPDDNTIFPIPLMLSNFCDIAVIQNEIDRSKILESLISRQSDTKLIFHSVTNVFIVYLLIDVPLACQIHLPELLLRHKGIKCLLRVCFETVIRNHDMITCVFSVLLRFVWFPNFSNRNLRTL